VTAVTGVEPFGPVTNSPVLGQRVCRRHGRNNSHSLAVVQFDGNALIVEPSANRALQALGASDFVGNSTRNQDCTGSSKFVSDVRTL